MANRKETRLNLNEFWTDRYLALMASAQGICNCLNNTCQGCFYLCPVCNSTKCMYLDIKRNNASLKDTNSSEAKKKTKKEGKKERTSKDTNLCSSEAKKKAKKERKKENTSKGTNLCSSEAKQ